jgi:hypothetical protein
MECGAFPPAMIDKIYQSDTKLVQACYSPPICTGVKAKVVEGNPEPAHISTS